MFRPFWSSSTSALTLASYQRWKRFWKRKPNLITHPLLIWGSTYSCLGGIFWRKNIKGLCENMEIHLPPSSSCAAQIFSPNTSNGGRRLPGYAIEALCTAELGGLETWKVNQSVPDLFGGQPSHPKKNVYPKIKALFFWGGGVLFFVPHLGGWGCSIFWGFNCWFSSGAFCGDFLELSLAEFKKLTERNTNLAFGGWVTGICCERKAYSKNPVHSGGLVFFLESQEPQRFLLCQMWWS